MNETRRDEAERRKSKGREGRIRRSEKGLKLLQILNSRMDRGGNAEKVRSCQVAH